MTDVGRARDRGLGKSTNAGGPPKSIISVASNASRSYGMISEERLEDEGLVNVEIYEDSTNSFSDSSGEEIFSQIFGFESKDDEIRDIRQNILISEIEKGKEICQVMMLRKSAV